MDIALKAFPLSEMNIKFIKSADTLDLRHRFLRPHQRRDECILDGDEDPGARHFGAFVDGSLEAILSMHRRDHPDMGPYGYQLRSMATSEKVRGQGYAAALLKAAEAHAIESSARYLWANARTPALGFYQKAGYKTISNEFELPNIGPHFVILKQL